VATEAGVWPLFSLLNISLISSYISAARISGCSFVPFISLISIIFYHFTMSSSDISQPLSYISGG